MVRGEAKKKETKTLQWSFGIMTAQVQRARGWRGKESLCEKSALITLPKKFSYEETVRQEGHPLASDGNHSVIYLILLLM